jgi:peptidase M28-like protein
MGGATYPPAAGEVKRDNLPVVSLAEVLASMEAQRQVKPWTGPIRSEILMKLLRLCSMLAAGPMAAQSSGTLAETAARISPSDVMRRISIIADDSMMGRGTPSRGLELTAAYVAAEFERAGLRPAGDSGGYIQRFSFTERAVDTTGSAVRLTTRAPNVVGILEGTDPALRQEYVAYSAHIDHIGITPGLADSINNGADDNASGVAGLLELVEAFTLTGARPRRSLIFLAPSAEEGGLQGSAHFTEHPTVPLGSIVANINMDLIGRNWPDSVIAVGTEQSDLGETLARVVQQHAELRMTPIADRWPEERIFYRSDHYNFARRGVPILFFTSGTHPDYHRPSDQPDRINGEKESRLLQLLFYLGTDIANRDLRPQWHPESYRQIVDHR